MKNKAEQGLSRKEGILRDDLSCIVPSRHCSTDTFPNKAFAEVLCLVSTLSRFSAVVTNTKFPV